MKSFAHRESQTLGSFAILPTARAAHALLPNSSELPNLQSRVTLLADSINDEAVRIVVSKVLADLVFLLDYLSLVDAAPREPSRINERLAILEAVRGESFALVEFIEHRLIQLEDLDDSF